MKRRTRLIVLIVVIAIAVPSIALGAFIASLDIPAVDLHDITFKSANRDTGTIVFGVILDVDNDNPVDALLIALNLEVWIDGQFSGVIVEEINQDIGANTNATLAVEFILCNAPALTSEVITVDVEGTAKVRVFTIETCLPVTETEEVNVREEFNQPPQAAITHTAGAFLAAHVPALFDGSRSRDQDGSIETYEWDFGDNSGKVYGSRVWHNFATGGQYRVTLTVYDRWNASGTDSVVIRVLGL